MHLMTSILSKISGSEKDENISKTPWMSVWVNKILQQISRNSRQHSLKISTEDCADLFKRVRDNSKQVFLALKSLGNQTRKDDDIK